MLAGKHGAARWHAHNILRMRTIKCDAVFAQCINCWRTSNQSAVATKCVVALLVGGDEKNLAAHLFPIKHFFDFGYAHARCTTDWKRQHFWVHVGRIHQEASIGSIRNHVNCSEMKRDQWVVDNFVLKATQIVVEGNDVFFKRDAGCKRDPTFVSLYSARSNWKSLM